MPTTLNKRNPKTDGRDWTVMAGVFVVPILVLALLAVLAINHPKASNWISDAVEAEFVASIFDSTQVPKPRVLHAAK